MKNLQKTKNFLRRRNLREVAQACEQQFVYGNACCSNVGNLDTHANSLTTRLGRLFSRHAPLHFTDEVRRLMVNLPA